MSNEPQSPRRRLGATGLDVFPLSFGGNVFGDALDEQQSHAVLDAYAAAGGNFVDTADTYCNWVDGNPPGLSETFIGSWMADRGNRDRLVVSTKIGYDDGLAPDTMRDAVAASLARLRVDRLDLLYVHRDDPRTPLAETLRTLDAFVRDGVVAHLGASNYSAARLAEALAICDREGLARFAVLQQHYNLVERASFEDDLMALCLEHGIVTTPYFALANGFLTGKHRDTTTPVDSKRTASARVHLHERGRRTLAALDAVAASHATTVAAVALAWLAAQQTVTAPIASARTSGQLADLLPMATLQLSSDELAVLSAASDDN